MSQAWRVIDCTGLQGTIASRRGRIVVSPEEKESVSIPTANVAVVLIGPNTVLLPGALHRLFSDDVAVLLCDWRGVPEGGCFGWHPHGRIGARHRAQAALTLPRQKSAWAALIRAKVTGQARCLAALDRPRAGELLALARKIRSGDPENIEAQAARLYWTQLFSDESFHRLPGCGDQRNSCLDYGYTILRGHGIRAVLAAGLAPALGIFHRGRSNAFNLVDDLIEPFRPQVDHLVASLTPSACPSDPEVKRLLVAGVSDRFSSAGISAPAEFEDLAQHFGQYVEGKIDRLSVPLWEASPSGIQGG